MAATGPCAYHRPGPSSPPSRPAALRTQVIAIFVMCMGVSVVGYVTSSITSIMAIKNTQQTNVAQRKQLVMDVLRTRSVPSELSRRVYNFFDYASSERLSGRAVPRDCVRGRLVMTDK